MHPWIGAGPEDRERILGELGLASIDDLFASVPRQVRIDNLPIPSARDEGAVLSELGRMAAANLALGGRPSFLGAGVYRHLQPAVVDAVLQRAEFFTSYTPYQPEITQGTLQVVFEFQTLISRLTGLEVANASLYDGATALVEAVLMAHRVLRGKRERVVIAETVHPIYRRVLDTYAGAAHLDVVAVPAGEGGVIDPDRLRSVVGEASCCVAVQSPNFLGVVEPLAEVAEAAHSAGALAVQVVTEPVSLGVLKGGGELGFDVVCGEAQPLGVAPGFGGPHLGFFSCRQDHVRQLPGRLVGETVDEDGRRAFCLTLSTREQHIRRSKATSNICTNQGLMALAATVWMEAVGGGGFAALARQNLSRSHALKGRIAEVGGGWRLAWPEAATFNEFLLLGPGPGEELAGRLSDEGILAGVPSRRWGGSWPDGLLVAVTELNPAEEIEAFAAALGRLS